MLLDKTREEGGIVFHSLKEGNEVLIECPQRWYIGRVASLGAVAVLLEEAAAVGQIGDLGQFLEGVVTDDTDITPLTLGCEPSLVSIQSVTPLAKGVLKRLRVRTHAKRPAKTDLPAS